jgi:hypothetical protein
VFFKTARLVSPAIILVAVAQVFGQAPARTRAPRLWTDSALADWALPIAGVNAIPNFYTEQEYYAARVDELRTYPVYVKNKEPKGYRDTLRARGPEPLIAIGRARSDADWAAAGREIFAGVDLAENRTDDATVLSWIDDATKARDEHALVTKDGVVIALRWVVDHDGKLKITLGECGSCHTRVLPDGSALLGAQGNLNFGLTVFTSIFAEAEEVRKRTARFVPPADDLYAQYGVPWLANDVNARLKTIKDDEIGRNRSVEDIARYAILVTDADDGSIGSDAYTNNKLVPVDCFTRIDHPQSPPLSDILVGARLGLDAGLALQTRKGTGYYKVPPKTSAR